MKKTLSVEEALEESRNKFWYTEPTSRAYSFLTDVKLWEKEIKKTHPIQFFLRETWSDLLYRLRDMYRNTRYYFKYLFKPSHPMVRKALPREWQDISSLIIDLNFAMILDFEKEADESWVDWQATEESRQFRNWLNVACNWIKEGRPNLQKQFENSFPPHPLPDHLKNKSYEELYAESNRLEKLIDDTDVNLLKQMMEYKSYFWT